MLLVLDTNTALSGLLWGGIPGQLIDAAMAGRLELAGSAALVKLHAPAIIAPTITKDPADDQVLAAALAAQADLIVSGDAHLLDLKRFHGIAIVTAAAAVESIGKR